MSTINELKWASLTGSVNEMKSPAQFLHRMLFLSNQQTVSTEDIELSVLTKSRESAPFVRKNGEAVMVQGTGYTFQTVPAPNIRIKIPFTPSQLLFGRQPGTVIFPSAGEQVSSVQAHINRDLQAMADMVTNSQEYLAAMAIQGVISYEVDEEEVFQISYPKPAGNTVTLSTFWDDATPADVEFNLNLYTAKKIASDEVGLAVTDCVLGEEAAEALLSLVAGGHVKALDVQNISAGQASFVEQFTDDGAIYMGSLDGIRFWGYPRTISVNGTATNLVRPKYAEFICRSPAAQFVEYFGAIPDMAAFQGGLFQSQRFAKSFMKDDPSELMALLHSRPLPMTRRPGATVSMKVVSG